MGYTTDFDGTFKLNKKLTKELHTLLNGLNETRRMKRSREKLKEMTGIDYGIDGELYIGGVGYAGQGHDDSVVDHNSPPKTQPSLWCQWRPTPDGRGIQWDQGEKFYNYVEWLEYIIDKVLVPNGYKLTGSVQWRGEDFNDIGTIVVKNNKIKVVPGSFAA
jgi:hypothetical protein